MSAAQGDDVQEFAALLRRLKDRTDRSYGQLARRLNMNTSTLHRYCAGDAVPLDFAPVERFAALCEATPEERLELHRRWILAVAARQRSRTAGPAATDRADGASSAAAGSPDDSPAEAPEEPAAPGAPARRPWFRRRHLLVSAAVATALLATLGGLSALPDDDRSRASDSVQGAGPTGTPPAGTPGPTSTPTESPKHSPTTPAPSDGAPASKKPKRTGPSDSPSKKSGAQQPPVGAPLTWSANSHVWQAGCGHDYVVTKSPQQVPPPPVPQDAEVWARSQGAVHGGQTMVKITVQGKTSTAVVLEALRVRVAGRAAPVEGTSYAMDHGCGGALTPRYFDVDLDKDRPIARPADGNDSGTTIPAMKLPYRVSAEDPEVLLVDARTDGCDCTWYLELDWSSQGRTGTVRIDDHGRPFRTTSTKGLPNYAYDTSARKWVPYN